MWQQGQAAEGAKWQMLNIARANYERSGDNTSLKDFADQYPDDSAGLWALLYSADAEIRSGLSDLGTDREKGFDKVKKAQDLYKQIVDSTGNKSPMLKRRSIFGLAYAYESNGDFDKAKDLYQTLVDSGDSNPLFGEADRGLKRVTNPELAAFFEKFKAFVPATDEEAPGESLPQRPDITFPADTEQPNTGGGDFGEGGEDSEVPETAAESTEEAEAPAEAGKAEQADTEAEQAASDDAGSDESGE